VRIGDRYQIGEALFEVTQPRVTCYRVGIRMDDPRIPALLVSHHRPGFYLRVLREVGANHTLVSMIILGGLGSFFIGASLQSAMPIFAGSNGTTAPLRRITLYCASRGSLFAASVAPVSPAIRLRCAGEDGVTAELATCMERSPVEILWFLASPCVA